MFCVIQWLRVSICVVCLVGVSSVCSWVVCLRLVMIGFFIMMWEMLLVNVFFSMGRC